MLPFLANKDEYILKCNKNHPLFTQTSKVNFNFSGSNLIKAVSLYNIGSAFHTASLLLHFPPLRSVPAFSTLAFLTVLHFPLPHFQSPVRNEFVGWSVTLLTLHSLHFGRLLTNLFLFPYREQKCTVKRETKYIFLNRVGRIVFVAHAFSPPKWPILCRAGR